MKMKLLFLIVFIWSANIFAENFIELSERLEVSPKNFNFRSVQVNTTRSKDFEIRIFNNSGVQFVNIFALNNCVDYNFREGLTQVIGVTKTKFRVRFNPKTAGTKTCNIQINSQDAGIKIIRLRGSGRDPSD